MRLSVIVPTYNRPDKLAATVAGLLDQSVPASDYEVIVVDDASEPPAAVPPAPAGAARCTLIRLDTMLERAVARNTAVEAARGEFVLFSDDDLRFERDFLAAHLRAHDEWPGALVTGKILLPPESLDRPGVQFRQNMELGSQAWERGPVPLRQFGSAANMSIARDRYRALGGFDPAMVGIEDQDFSMRHSADGSPIVFLPEAVAIHDDEWLDFPSFCRRQAWASQCSTLLAQRYPELSVHAARFEALGPPRWGVDPRRSIVRKLGRSVLSSRPVLSTLFAASALLGRAAPTSRATDLLYRLLLGIHLQKGFRKGLSLPSPGPPPPAASNVVAAGAVESS